MKRQKFVVSVRRAELMVLTRNADGTFDLEYAARKDRTPAKLSATVAATIPPNGVPYCEDVGGVDYTFVCDKKTGAHLGFVCDCGFRSYFDTRRPCKDCKSCTRQKGGQQA